jgi:hypothetical protein
LLAAKEPPADIPSGQGSRVEMKVNTEGFSGGPIEKFIYVHTNDPRNPEITLSIKAVVEPEFVLTDSIIFFRSAPRGTQIVKEIDIEIPSDKLLKILSVRSDDPNVTARLDPAPGSDASKFKLIAVRKANAKPGYHYGNIIIKTNSRYRPEIRIPENGEVK